ncbi:NGG1p interacting factor NIF3 [Vibrio hippocampi]|uniref:GTP cyclohydrolase 1 type 2 n=1 Tax=Vibrio hippocampi TaxID=654686 RepID=A0ABN8DKQ6_9VIBR|nr:NGG1p interacting factor NIF3 [Vibrio hippocampi]CAH0529213.1 GTP cyclohydrolase 1 type 2 [Vibrio hippocampi]
MKKIVFFVPVNDAEAVKNAVFDAGAGRIGDYDRCCFQLEGQGQFRPLAGANPHIGSHGEVEKVRELRVELVCEDHLVKTSIEALLAAHPYEEVAFEVMEILDWQTL